jgi:hypothetical protein
MAAARAARRPPSAPKRLQHPQRRLLLRQSRPLDGGRPAKKAVKPAAKRRELKSDALEEEVESAWGTLPVGTLVLDAQHTNLLMQSKRVYGDNPHLASCAPRSKFCTRRSIWRHISSPRLIGGPMSRERSKWRLRTMSLPWVSSGTGSVVILELPWVAVNGTV